MPSSIQPKVLARSARRSAGEAAERNGVIGLCMFRPLRVPKAPSREVGGVRLRGENGLFAKVRFGTTPWQVKV